jgi:hypothetical protein
VWLMTSFGILMPAARPVDTVASGDPRTMQVRARRRVDLEVLRDEYMGDDLGEIIHTPDMDYNYRAYCTPEAFGAVVAQLVEEIDYLKFKPTTESRYKDALLHRVYDEIWSVVTMLGTPWEGRSRRVPKPRKQVKTAREGKNGVKPGPVKSSPFRLH